MSSTNPSTPNFEKVTHLYFDDGDIVISARRPGSDTMSLFKLHRRVLATQAKGLAGVLCIPAAEPDGANSNEHFEGSPVVRLCDDPADLAGFFKAMYAPSTLIFRRSMATNAANAYPLLVLADKYIADDIECMIEFQLRQDWPKSVSEWDAFECHAVQAYRMHRRTRAVGRWDALVPEPASYIRLARIAKVVERARVAAAFYQLSRMKSVNDWDARESPFGEWPQNPTPAQLAKLRRAMWSILSEDELHRVAEGKKRIANHISRMVQMVPRQVNLCTSCSQGWQTVATNFVTSDDVLSELLKYCVVDNPDSPLRPYMCFRCRTAVSRAMLGERARLWNMLPDYFEVYPNERACIDTFCTADSEFVLM